MANILFLTNSELGQCNVAFAIAEEFLRRGEYGVHIGSYSQLAANVEQLNQRIETRTPATFHEIYGPCMTDLAIRSDVGLLCHPPGVAGAMKGFNKISTAMSSWKHSEYAKAYRSILAMFERVKPAVVIVDPLLHVGLDACKTANIKPAILWPVPVKDVVTLEQGSKIVWHYPAVGSGFPYPLPFKLIPSNLYLIFQIAMTFASGKTPQEDPGSEKDMDFPCKTFDNVVCCGPILHKREPLSKSDPEMEAWLTKPTVLISLGSHMKPTPEIAVQMAKAVKIVLGKHPGKQVLWKLRWEWEESKEFQDILGPAVAEGRVLITPWIKADIMSVLETGRIAAYVHHGGANSYHEACKAGTPQVILPQWLDTYDCATRVEYLGLGAHGSRTSAPGAEATEFAEAMDRVLGDEGIRTKVAAIKDLCQTTEGRIVAHDRIVELAKQNTL
ncbi:hypothetical protein N7470_005061 [Penicillium chermesinum]|nr:hypothetical protein N7470_005061 [Penicillium chermesinum]